MKAILSLPGIAVGVSTIVYGEVDDSPGLQGLGLLICVVSLVFFFKSIDKRCSRLSQRDSNHTGEL